MTIRTTPIRSTLLLPVVVLLAVVATACGSTVAESTADRTAESAVAPSPVTLSTPATSESGHQYGASLEDWGDTVRANDVAPEPSDTAADATESADSAYMSIEWEDLVPLGQSGQDIVSRFEERLAAVEPGSAEASALYEEMQAEFDPAAVNTELDGQQIRLAGFVAPLTYEGELVTEFLLVPNFGACVHVPPPPPNQTIMVALDAADGLTVEEAWGPVWVEGTMTIASTTTDLAPASYTITSASSGVYNDF